MDSKIILCVALGLVIPFNHSLAGETPSTDAPAPKIMHDWEYIMYPMTVNDGWAPGSPFFTITSDNKELGLCVNIDGLSFDFFKTHHITARLYRANGEVVDPTAEGKQLLNSPISVQTASRPGGMEPDCQVMTFFPWSPNTMEESWIEISTGAERYWLEIPYGFDRNPQDPLPPPMPGGPPKVAPAMKHPTGHDHVIHWLNVQYDLGKIQNGWRLSLIQSNPFDGQSEVVLYRDDMVVGRSMYLWGLHSPRTALRVLGLNGAGIGVGGFCTDIRLHDDGMRRSDTFLLNRNGDDVRCWGQIEITVDDKSYRVVVPSSLYKYTHGHARAN
jgi:hypothetical protein